MFIKSILKALIVNSSIRESFVWFAEFCGTGKKTRVSYRTEHNMYQSHLFVIFFVTAAKSFIAA